MSVALSDDQIAEVVREYRANELAGVSEQDANLIINKVVPAFKSAQKYSWNKQTQTRGQFAKGVTDASKLQLAHSAERPPPSSPHAVVENWAIKKVAIQSQAKIASRRLRLYLALQKAFLQNEGPPQSLAETRALERKYTETVGYFNRYRDKILRVTNWTNDDDGTPYTDDEEAGSVPPTPEGSSTNVTDAEDQVESETARLRQQLQDDQQRALLLLAPEVEEPEANVATVTQTQNRQAPARPEESPPDTEPVPPQLPPQLPPNPNDDVQDVTPPGPTGAGEGTASKGASGGAAWPQLSGFCKRLGIGSLADPAATQPPAQPPPFHQRTDFTKEAYRLAGDTPASNPRRVIEDLRADIEAREATLYKGSGSDPSPLTAQFLTSVVTLLSQHQDLIEFCNELLQSTETETDPKRLRTLRHAERQLQEEERLEKAERRSHRALREIARFQADRRHDRKRLGFNPKDGDDKQLDVLYEVVLAQKEKLERFGQLILAGDQDGNAAKSRGTGMGTREEESRRRRLQADERRELLREGASAYLQGARTATGTGGFGDTPSASTRGDGTAAGVSGNGRGMYPSAADRAADPGHHQNQGGGGAGSGGDPGRNHSRGGGGGGNDPPRRSGRRGGGGGDPGDSDPSDSSSSSSSGSDSSTDGGGRRRRRRPRSPTTPKVTMPRVLRGTGRVVPGGLPTDYRQCPEWEGFVWPDTVVTASINKPAVESYIAGKRQVGDSDWFDWRDSARRFLVEWQRANGDEKGALLELAKTYEGHGHSELIIAAKLPHPWIWGYHRIRILEERDWNIFRDEYKKQEKVKFKDNYDDFATTLNVLETYTTRIYAPEVRETDEDRMNWVHISQWEAKLPPDARSHWEKFKAKRASPNAPLSYKHITRWTFIMEMRKYNDKRRWMDKAKLPGKKQGGLFKTESSSAKVAGSQSGGGNGGKKKGFTVGEGKVKYKCGICVLVGVHPHRQEHSHDIPLRCPRLKNMTDKEIVQTVRNNKACISCFTLEHAVKDCKAGFKCGVDGCQGAHNKVFHGQKLGGSKTAGQGGRQQQQQQSKQQGNKSRGGQGFGGQRGQGNGGQRGQGGQGGDQGGQPQRQMSQLDRIESIMGRFAAAQYLPTEPPPAYPQQRALPPPALMPPAPATPDPAPSVLRPPPPQQ